MIDPLVINAYLHVSIIKPFILTYVIFIYQSQKQNKKGICPVRCQLECVLVGHV
jgi:hypothetical protein